MPVKEIDTSSLSFTFLFYTLESTHVTRKQFDYFFSLAGYPRVAAAGTRVIIFYGKNRFEVLNI